MGNTDFAGLAALCRTFRRDVIRALYEAQSGHPGGSLSCCEILTALYFHAADITPDNFPSLSRDKIVLSKGHAAPMLYRILAEKGFFPKEEMGALRKFGSRLQGHPGLGLPGIDIPSGPLGIAYGAALGLALSDRLSGRENRRVYAVLGDGELNEGVVWETAMSAAKFRAANLITIVDRNHVQLDGPSDQIMPLGDLGAKWESFGFRVICADGHSLPALCQALDRAKAQTDRPAVILAETVKGKGVSFMEGQSAWHGRPLDHQQYEAAMAELGGMGDA